MSIKGLFAIAMMCLSAPVFAQDKIFKSNGDVLEVKIRSVERNMISFLRYDNLSGPEYTIPKREVDKIRYENGSEETFNNDRMPGDGMQGDDRRGSFGQRYRGMVYRRMDNERFKGQYKPNILSFAPMQMTEFGAAGFSFSYERALDVNSIVAFYVPAMMVFNLNSRYDNNTGNTVNSNDAMFYLTPGIKLYPTGGYGLAKYAIGPSLVIGSGQKTGTDNFGMTVSQSDFVLGMMVNQSLNLNPSPHLYLGLEFGLGYTYVNQLAGLSQGTETLVQFSFRIGYRY
jgi:hypothetical protein